MSVAGVRLTDGRVVWLDPGEVEVGPLDQVIVELDGSDYPGVVIVAPDALLRPVQTTGRILCTTPHANDDGNCSGLPGADMPPLGTRTHEGVVVAVDAVRRTVTIETSDGTRRSAVAPKPS